MTKLPPSNIHSNRILLVEDNPGDARLVELYLGESDLSSYLIVNCTSLQESCDLLQKEEFAIVLLDLSLPDSRGFITLERLLSQAPDANVIVMTGLSDQELGLKAVQVGAQDFIVKGDFKEEELVKSVRYAIERKKSLRRLAETQRIAGIGSWEYDSSSNTFSGSAQLHRILNTQSIPKEDLQKDIKDSTSPFFLFNEIHEAAIRNRFVEKDIHHKTTDGREIFMYVKCTAETTGDNTFIFSGIVQDITERKQAEQERLKAKERYQTIFNNSKEAIYVCSLNGELIDFNPATARLFGFDKEELLQEEDIHAFFGDDEARNRMLGQLRFHKSVREFELFVNQRNGNVRNVVVNASLVETGDQIAYNAVIRDITESKQTEELRKARDLARQSAQMKEQFIASISHEMRTPLNAILGMSNLALKTELNPEQFNYLSSIKQSSEILLGVINDILEIANAQEDKIDFEYKDFNLIQLLHSMMNVMEYKMKEKDIKLELEIADDVPKYVKGDELRLNQILYNLVGNAIKFTDDGLVKLSVKVLNKPEGHSQIQFVVSDTGIGIPPDKHDAIFETFTRIRQKDRLYEGTGLGLSIVKSLVEQQGGKIFVKSIVGEGSTFFFDIIFEEGQAPLPELEEEVPGEVLTDRLPDDKCRILIVEDNRLNQLVARKTLEKQWENVEITIAENGKVALNHLEKSPFNIILMDIQMPVMDGYETTRYIREKMPPHIANLSILAMTAHAHISKDEKFKEYGMDDFVLKPFEPKQLFRKILQYIK